MVLIALQGELLRIGVNINRIARALNVAMMEGIVLNLQISALEHSAAIYPRQHPRDARRLRGQFRLLARRGP
jgi:hypothetical protein